MPPKTLIQTPPPQDRLGNLAHRVCRREKGSKICNLRRFSGVHGPSRAHTPCTRVVAGVSQSLFEPLSESNEGNEEPGLSWCCQRRSQSRVSTGSSESAGDRDASEARELCPKTPNLFASQRSRLLAAVPSALCFSQPTKVGPGTRAGVQGSSTEDGGGGGGVAQGNAHLLTQSEGAGPA